ncbi:MAG: transketolase family protein [Candidatus Wildermuthbacteria bacterium]|nr:transketolase family protein [Candidatus Wildermuthbacteria bacterium]
MVNPKARLSEKLFQNDIGKIPTRNGYGEGLVAAGEENTQVVVLCADLTESTRSEAFQKKFPERFIEVGVAEQNMASLAAGMALAGKVPFISSYATFSPGRNNEQIRTTIAINNVNVKIAGAHAGVSVGPDGATHQALEDMALMRAMPRMNVVYPCDALEAKKATLAASRVTGPVYLRFARTIVACGPLLYEALLAAQLLEKEGVSVEVVNNHTIKPLDQHTILQSVRKTKALVTVEEHQVAGGMGSAVVEMLSQQFPVPVEMVGVKDRFGESGEPDELWDVFGLSHPHIIEAVKRVMKRK